MKRRVAYWACFVAVGLLAGAVYGLLLMLTLTYLPY